MKRIYKSCVAVLLLLAMLLSCVPALAAGSSHSYTTLQKAEALKTLGLFQGTNKGFELEKTLTREQAITLIVRLLGAEAEAKEKNPAHPFTDRSGLGQSLCRLRLSECACQGRQRNALWLRQARDGSTVPDDGSASAAI